MANQTATDYGLYPARAVQVGTNRMHTNMVTTISASASDNMYMFPIPADCMVVGGKISASAPSGLTTNVILEIGILSNNTLFGTYTVSGSAALAITAFNFAPKTVSSSGTDATQAVIISCLSAGTSTTSISIYLQLNYVMPGIIN